MTCSNSVSFQNFLTFSCFSYFPIYRGCWPSWWQSGWENPVSVTTVARSCDWCSGGHVGAHTPKADNWYKWHFGTRLLGTEPVSLFLVVVVVWKHPKALL